MGNRRRLRPVSAVFATPSAVEILRVLAGSRGMSNRQLARTAGVNHQVCADVVKDLERFRLLERIQMGNCIVARLNEANGIVAELILPLFDKEREMIAAVEGSIRRRLDGCKVLLRGAAAGVGHVDVIAHDVDKVKSAAAELSAGFEERYGFDIRFNVYSYKDAPLELVME